MRIAFGGLLHESNTFCPIPTTVDSFRAGGLLRGAAIAPAFEAAHHEVGGFLEVAGEAGAALTPVLLGSASPAGRVTAACFDELVGELVAGLAATAADGVYLALHGAMVSEEHPDADGEIIARVRAAIGPETPLAVSLDYHTNLSPRMVELADSISIYQTYPHIDQRDCGRAAGRLLCRQIAGEIRPAMALAQPPVVLNLLAQETAAEPMASALAEVAGLAAEPGVLQIHLAGGFPYADVLEMGTAGLVTTDGDEGLAKRLAVQVSRLLWRTAEAVDLTLPSAAEAVLEAIRSEQRPVVLVDFGDNVGGGSSADGTLLLREILAQGASESVVTLHDPEAVAACQAAGIGGQVELTVGGRQDDGQGGPLPIAGEVAGLFRGDYTEPEPRHGGRRYLNQGLTAVVRLAHDNLLVLTSHRSAPFSLRQLTSLGIDPAHRRLLVVKAAIAYKAAYAPLGGPMIVVDTPGYTAVDPTRFEYTCRRRPMFPFETLVGKRLRW